MRLFALAVAFFLSGTAALIYQTVWQRIVALHTGIGLASISVIVASFMLGLGLGSHLGGTLSTRLDERRSLLAFGLVEVLIAAWGAASAWIYYDLLYTRWSWLYAETWRAVPLHAISLGIPTTLMGMSLPLLVRATVRESRLASRTIGFLYGLNVLGAATGSILGPFYFVRHHGMTVAVQAAAVANLVAGIAAFILALALGRRAMQAVAADTPAAEVPPGEALGRWAMLYAASGFCALGLELLWFRVFEVSVKASAFTFGALLAVYLLGNGLGSLFGSWWAPRIRRPLYAFLLAQCLLLAYAAAVLTLLVRLPADGEWLSWYYHHWGTSRVLNLDPGIRNLTPQIRLYIHLPLLLFGPPTLLMGFSYPVLQRAVQDDPRTSGRKVGFLQAANILGCVAGSLLVGLVLLDRLGTPGTLVFLLACGLGFAALGLREYGLRSAFLPAALALVIAAVAVPDVRTFWLRFHGTPPQANALVAEDGTGVVMLVEAGKRWAVWAGGRSHSWLPFGSVHTVLGAAPAIMHPAPGRVAVIGLGSGDTAWASGCRRDVAQKIDVFEIYAKEQELLQQLSGLPTAPPELGPFLKDPRFAFLVQDGRNALLRARPEYDLVEMDALWPVSPYSGNLYSQEFFAMVSRRLRKNGLMCIWSPTERVRLGFARAFPHVVSLSKGSVLVGSLDPIPLDPAAWSARLQKPEVASYLGEKRAADVWKVLSEARATSVRPSMGKQVNEDLYPRDEFRARRGPSKDRGR